MKYVLKKYHHDIPDKVLLSDLRRTAKKLGKRNLSLSDYTLEGTYNSTTISRRFGSWNNALLKAGLKITRPAAKEDMLKNIKRLWDTLKRQPQKRDLVRPLSKYSIYVYIRKFGSWYTALEEFVRLHSHPDSKHYKIKKPAVKIKKKKNVPYNITKSLRFDIMKRDKFKCRLCGRSPATHPDVTLHVDHIKPRSKGGQTNTGNLWTLCCDCNYGKGNKTIDK